MKGDSGAHGGGARPARRSGITPGSGAPPAGARNVLAQVVERDRCIGCGVCAGVCPSGALDVRIVENGDLRATPGRGACAAGCRLCLQVCPFRSGVHDARAVGEHLFVGAGSFHDDVGQHVRSLVGHRVGEDLRGASASGGLLTWALEQLITRGLVTKVAVVRWAPHRAEGKPPFEFIAASTKEDIRAAAGSVYHPIEISGLLREIVADTSNRWAVVGVPCLCTALRSTPALRRKVRYVLGLACGMYQNSFYTELLAGRSGVPASEPHRGALSAEGSGPGSGRLWLRRGVRGSRR